ncbi:MAG: hypothetical protein ABIS86_09825 [Streptosporangiaceae bacterium]
MGGLRLCGGTGRTCALDAGYEPADLAAYAELANATARLDLGRAAGVDDPVALATPVLELLRRRHAERPFAHRALGGPAR